MGGGVVMLGKVISAECGALVNDQKVCRSFVPRWEGSSCCKFCLNDKTAHKGHRAYGSGAGSRWMSRSRVPYCLAAPSPPQSAKEPLPAPPSSGEERLQAIDASTTENYRERRPEPLKLWDFILQSHSTEDKAMASSSSSSKAPAANEPKPKARSIDEFREEKEKHEQIKAKELQAVPIVTRTQGGSRKSKTKVHAKLAGIEKKIAELL